MKDLEVSKCPGQHYTHAHSRTGGTQLPHASAFAHSTVNPKYCDIPEGSESRQDHGSLPGTPLGSSDSDCSSDPHDGRLFTVSEISSTGENNALGLEFTYEAVISGSQAVATSIPLAESLGSPRHHQDARSRDRPNQEHCVQQEHLVPQPDSPANETLAGRCPQDICLGADVSDASGLEVSRNNRHCSGYRETFQGMQGPDKYCQRTDIFPGSRTPGRDDDPEDKPSTRFLGELEEATAAGVSMHSVIAQPNSWGLLRAPRMHPVPLPGGGEDHGHLLYDQLDLGGQLHITLDGVPGTITLSRLDVALSVPFSMDN